MQEGPDGLEKLYSMLHEADTLGLSRPARLRLIGIIGSLESEELERFRGRERAEQGRDRQARSRDVRGISSTALSPKP
jgi:hypothetical protein